MSDDLHFKGLRLQSVSDLNSDALSLLEQVLTTFEDERKLDVGALEEATLIVGMALAWANGEHTCEDILDMELETVREFKGTTKGGSHVVQD